MKTAICAAVLLAVTVVTAAAETGKQDDSQSCKAFVQSFYDWYVPLANRQDLKGPASDLALKNKKAAFSENLYQALKADSEAQARSQEIVGIDFDPFLSSQDPDPRYEVRAVEQAVNRCSAEVFGVGTGEVRVQPDVIAKLAYANGRWTFVNFQYPSLKTDLLQVLKQLAQNRKASAQ
jgi:hypothetical protein